MIIQENTFAVVVKTNAPKNELLGYNSEKGAYLLHIKAKPEHNKANLEIIKFLSKILKKRVGIVSGLTSNKKIIKTYD